MTSPRQTGSGMISAIRLAGVADLAAINAIYNHYVLCSTCTFQEVPETHAESERWFARHDEAHPVIVAELQEQIVGWGSLSRFYARSAYRFTVENSIYVDPAFHGRGIGSALLADLISRGRTQGHHAMVAAIEASQTASLALHTRFGFTPAGHLREVGFKFHRWLDVLYLELRL